MPEPNNMFLNRILLYVLLFKYVDLTMVKVQQGILQGKLINSSTGNSHYYCFKGIPYAAPPVGELRFKAPQSAPQWTGIRNATEHGSVCPQIDFLTRSFTPGNEDCLYLNVYTPTINPQALLPVIFYIHGGGFVGGSGNDDRYGPDFLLDENVIIVTINYRLGALGFLCLDIREVPGNAGIKDQVAALRWVKINIKSFGGDPDNVTIFGHSVGGSAVSLHALSPMSKGLFKRGIASSGVCFNDFAMDLNPKRHSLLLTQKLGLFTTDAKKAFKFLQNASVEDIVKAETNILAIEKLINDSSYEFRIVVERDFGDEHFLLEQPQEILQKRRNNDVQLIFGYALQEGVNEVVSLKDKLFNVFPHYKEMLIPLKIYINLNSKQILELADFIYNHYFGDNEISVKNIKSFIKFYSDLNFVYDIYRYVQMWTSSGNQAYFYVFSSFSERNVFGKNGIRYGIKAAAHEDDLMYLFDGKMYNLTLDKNSSSYKMILQSCKLFTNFAKCGNPTPDNSLGILWPFYNTNHSILNIDLDLKLYDSYEEVVMVDFWRDVFRYAGLKFS